MKETKFKDTEVGLIPEDWKVKRLKDIVTLINGRAYKQEELLFSGKYKVLRVGNFFSNDNWYYSNLELDDKQYCNNGDLLYAWSCTYGAYIWNQSKTIFHYHIWKVIISSELHKVFLQYLLNNDVEEQKKTSQGSTMSHITKGFMEDRVFPIPSLPEQHRIASALTSIDNLISSLDKLIEKKKNIKQGAMQQLLTGKKRLKGFNEPWQLTTIGKCFGVFDGTHQTPSYVDNGIPFYSVENVMADDFIHTKYISLNEHHFLTTKIKMEKGDVLMTRIGTIGVCKYIDWCVEASYYVSLSLLKAKGKVDALFFSFASATKHFKDSLALHSLLYAIPQKINLQEIKKVSFLCPTDLKEQRKIATILTDISKEISDLESKKSKYEKIKQGMMQQLLTGRIRLVETNVKTNTTSANIHFRRSVLAAEIAGRLCDEPTFGHVKMEKILFLTERLCHLDLSSHYHRDAAGPYDNKALRSIDSQLKKQKWFEVQRTEKGYRYVPMQNSGKHKTYFNRYYSDILPTFDKIINTFKTQNTERCEIVATLYSAWEDLLHSNKSFTDADIVNEVLNNWHESKKRISQDRWLKAIQWMRDNGFAPDMSVCMK